MIYAGDPLATYPQPSPDTDRDLLSRVAAGDQSAFATLYDRLSGPLYSLAFKILGNEADAEDALQEACLQIWRRAGSYDLDKSTVFTWAVLITRSKVIDHLRAKGRKQRLIQEVLEGDDRGPDSVASATRSAADIVEKSDEAARVQTILSQLAPEQRQAIELAFFGDLTHHDISAQLGEPLGTVKARIRRGLLRLRDTLGKSRGL